MGRRHAGQGEASGAATRRRDRYRLRRSAWALAALGVVAGDEESAEALATHAGDASAEDQEARAELAKAESRLEEANQELATLRDGLTRQRAEFDNFRRRTLKEKDQVRDMAKEDLIGKLLPVIDNFDRALDSSKAATDPTVVAVREGVSMVAGQLRRILEGEGLEQVQAHGAAFDPLEHEALAIEERTDVPENHVSEVMLAGYRLKGKVIRPSMVKVARSQPATNPGISTPPVAEAKNASEQKA